MVKVPGAGPQPAKILIIGEAPGKEEELQRKPFVGGSGQELTKMLNEAGILRSECRIVNVCKYRPPGNNMDLWWPEQKKNRQKDFVEVDGEWFDPRVVEGLQELDDEIKATNPNIIIPLGNLPLWATTRNTGILKWRSSLLTHHSFPEIKVVPTIHPAAIMRNWEWRYLAVHDLRRAKGWSHDRVIPRNEEHFIVRPSYAQCIALLRDLLARAAEGPLLLAADIETAQRQLSCIGLAWSRTEAICIPFATQELTEHGYSYFSHREELDLVLLLREVLTQPNVRVVGQNWGYDSQYIAKQYGFEVNLYLDTMTEHHTKFPGLPKGLDFQSSLYRRVHVYWKDDGKERGKGADDQWWIYNCRDCVATYEIAEVQLASREKHVLKRTAYGTPYEIQQSLSVPIIRASMRGVRFDNANRFLMAMQLQERCREIEEWIAKVLGEPLNPRSSPQMHKLFYEELGQAKVLDRKTRKPTCNDQALRTFAQTDILLRPLCSAISQVRSLSNYISVCLQPTDSDGRIRCTYTIPGTETFRFASSSDPFGYGTNLQNITSGDEESQDFPLPNLRKLFLPDIGYTLGEFDLPQADARVVAFEAEDEELIELFLDPTRDLHTENAKAIFGDHVTKKSPERQQAKAGVHLTNYGGTPPVLAKALGITVKEAERFQQRWFGAHPKIKKWHERILMQLQLHRFVENKFGYRRYYFDRIDNLLKEALAWIPQSTVGIATNLGILQVYADDELRRLLVQLLLQTHDSTTFQWPTIDTKIIVPKLISKLTVTVPYDRPLVFTPGVKMSDKSWGDCK